MFLGYAAQCFFRGPLFVFAVQCFFARSRPLRRAVVLAPSSCLAVTLFFRGPVLFLAYREQAREKARLTVPFFAVREKDRGAYRGEVTGEMCSGKRRYTDVRFC